MSPIGWLMIGCGLCGAVFLAIGIRHAFAGRRARRERAKLMRLAREWDDRDGMPAGRMR